MPQPDAAPRPPPESFVERARAEFAECADPATGGRGVSCESLARRWLALVEGRGQGMVGQTVRQTMALRVAQVLRDMDLTGRGFAEEHEWMHHALLSETGGCCALVRGDLTQAMAKHDGLLKSIIAFFAKVDVTGVGYASYDDLVAQHALGQFVLTGPHSKLLYDHLGLQQASDTSLNFARLIISRIVPSEPADQLPAVEATSMSYTQFVAHCIGRRHSEVRIRLYDLMMGSASKISPWLLGRELEGIWHASVVVFGAEYSFTRDCVFNVTGKSHFGTPKKELHVGHTLCRNTDLHRFIVHEMRPIFNRETYDIVTNNCNHFADKLLVFLTGRRLPEEVLRQPEYLLVSGAVRFAKPILNWFLQDNIVAHELTIPTPESDGDTGRCLSPIERPRPGTAVLIRCHCISGNYRPTPIVGVVSEPSGDADELARPVAGGKLSVLVRYFEAGAYGGFHVGAGVYISVEERISVCHLSELERAFSEPGYRTALRELSLDALASAVCEALLDDDEVRIVQQTVSRVIMV